MTMYGMRERSRTPAGEPAAEPRAARVFRNEQRWPEAEAEGRQQPREVKQRKGVLATALGWFSVGLGLAQVIAPGAIARLIGIKDNAANRRTLRLVGARELSAAAGIFGQDVPLPWLWARVAGDAMDLTLLGRALNVRRNDRNRVTAAFAAVAGIAGLDLLQSIRLTLGALAARRQGPYLLSVKKAITVNRSREEVYAFWHDFSNLPKFMKHLESVQVMSERRSHWKTRAPFGRSVEWDAAIVDDRVNELIAWRALMNADVDNEGSVSFAPAPGNRGTEVRVELLYNLPGGPIGKTIASLFGESPDQQVYDDLRAFKQIIETGEVIQSDATIHDHPHPAQPPTDDFWAKQTRRDTVFRK